MSHMCPAARSCDVRLPDSLLACRSHWYQLPPPLRRRIMAEYRQGQTALTMSPAYEQALSDAMDFWRTNA